MRGTSIEVAYKRTKLPCDQIALIRGYRAIYKSISEHAQHGDRILATSASREHEPTLQKRNDRVIQIDGNADSYDLRPHLLSTMQHSTLFDLFLSTLLSTLVSANPLQLNLPPTLTLNTTILQSQTHCFKRTLRRRLYPTKFVDCHNALNQLIFSRPNYEYHLPWNFTRNVTAGVENYWHLPIHETNDTCQITLSTNKYEDVAVASLAQISDELMEEGKGVLQQCLLSPDPLGGTTSVGAGHELLINVLGIAGVGDGVATE